jgi:hypothetical protein
LKGIQLQYQHRKIIIIGGEAITITFEIMAAAAEGMSERERTRRKI